MYQLSLGDLCSASDGEVHIAQERSCRIQRRLGCGDEGFEDETDLSLVQGSVDASAAIDLVLPRLLAGSVAMTLQRRI